jgi:hypothetical protein
MTNHFQRHSKWVDNHENGNEWRRFCETLLFRTALKTQHFISSTGKKSGRRKKIRTASTKIWIMKTLAAREA